MKKAAFLVVLGLLIVVLAALALLNFTRWGVPFRYEKTALVSPRAFDSIKSLPDELLSLENGWLKQGSAGGASEDYANRKSFQYASVLNASAREPSQAQSMAKLLEIVRSLEQRAQQAGFALTESGIRCDSFGDDGEYGPEVTWNVHTTSITGRSRSREIMHFPPSKRQVLVSLEYIAVSNPAAGFRWTILCDRKEASFVLIANYFAVSPVYVGPDTPKTGQTLKIMPAGSDDSSAP